MQSFRSRRLSIRIAAGLVLVLAIASPFALAGAQSEGSQVIHACYSTNAVFNGMMRHVSANTPCRRGEARITFNQQGPVGPQGAQGPQGETGEQGPQGSQGPAGENGVQGQQGEQGPQGETGPQGSDGAQGEQGPQGELGPQGAPGAAGQQGPQGETGPQGATGAQGPQGEKGEKGDPGDLTGYTEMRMCIASHSNGTSTVTIIATSQSCPSGAAQQIILTRP